MQTADLEVLRVASQWYETGHRIWLATVIHTWGSSPRPVGSMMIIREDGHVRGSVSGGCVEDDLIDAVRRGTLTHELPFTLKYGLTADEAHRFGLPCGGTLEIVMEPLKEHSQLLPMLRKLHQGDLVKRVVEMKTGRVTIEEGKENGQTEYGDGWLTAYVGPRYRLILIGAGQLSRYVAQFALALDYAVTVCDPRDEYLDEWDIPGVECVKEMPDDLVIRMQPDARTAVATLTHDPKLDDMALIEALTSTAFYVGAVGSRRNNAERRKRLALFDLTPDQINRLHGPIGLHLGARTPPEIALAIMAELTAHRNNVPVLQTHAAREAGQAHRSYHASNV